MLKFKRNMGTLDRTIRIIVGVFLLTLGPIGHLVHMSLSAQLMLGILGILAIASALSAYCLLYELTGSNTAKKKAD